MVFSEIKGLMALETSYEEGFTEKNIRCLSLHTQIITEFAASIVADKGWNYGVNNKTNAPFIQDPCKRVFQKIFLM
jgi:hypothetical protein